MAPAFHYNRRQRAVVENCPSENVIQGLMDGRLPREQVLYLHRHVAQCENCRIRFAELAPTQDSDLAFEHTGTLESAVPAVVAPASGPFVGLAGLPDSFDEYRLLRLLGSGAMGQVFLARDMLLDRLVAIKFVAVQRGGEQARERFRMEARAIARLQHPNVVAIHRIGEVAGRPYLVSEFVRGESLDRLAKPVPWQRALAIGIGLARGLGAAHRRGVLHRDIKPANAILTRDGEVKLLDFGLAKLLAQRGPAPSRPPLEQSQESHGAASPSLTGPGALIGTPAYLAPELWRGEPATRRSDLYSLGALLFDLCSGGPPHRATTLGELRWTVQGSDAPSLADLAPGVDARLAAAVDCCLRRDPAKRPASCDELCQTLEGLAPEVRVPSRAEDNPYRGLLPFQAEHRALFFGRAQEVRDLIDRLRAGPLVLVTGSSGAGKSSLCRAGVLPLAADGALGEGRQWRCASLVPGRRPLVVLCDVLVPVLETGAEYVQPLLQQPSADLGRALRRRLGEQHGLLLFIDQMEELVTQSDPVEAVLFGEVLGYLAEGIPGVRMLMTVRGDFLTRLLEVTGLADDLAQGLYLLRQLSAEGLREAIVGPARVKGIAFESEEMVTTLVESTRQAEGGLPLLQFALAQLWDVRDPARHLIPERALEAIGGVAGALSRHADGVLALLAAEQHGAARRVLLRLVTLEGTRARRQESELRTGDPADGGALEALVRGRLLVVQEAEGGGATYEVAHEALVQGWGMLRNWLAADLDGRALQERMEAAAVEWERLGHGRDALWGEPQLKEVDVVAPDPAGLHPRAVEFLAASRQQAGRRQRMRWGVTAALLCLPLLLLLIGQQWQKIRQERQRTEAIGLERLGVRADNLAQLPGQGVPALVTAIQAVGPSMRRHQVPSVFAMVGLSAAVSAGRHSLPLTGHSDTVFSAEFSPDGQRIVTASEDRTARLWDAHSGQPLITLAGHGKSVHSAAFSRDGTRIVTASEDSTARLWDGRTARLLATLKGHTASVQTANFSADGARIVTASDDGTARLWDGHTGRLLATLRGHTDRVTKALFSPDDSLVVTASDDRTARVWDGQGGQPQAILHGHEVPVRDASFSPDGQRIVTASERVRVWDAHGGKLFAMLQTDTVRVARYSPDGKFIVSGHQDAIGRVWDAGTGGLHGLLKGHTLSVAVVTFSGDGQSVITSGADGTARIWDLESGQQLAVLDGHGGSIRQASFSADGQRILTACRDGTARLWSLHAGVQHLTLAGHRGAVMNAAFSLDGKYAATVSWDKTARVWDAHSGHPLFTLSGHEKWVQSVAFSPDGMYLATGSGDNTARVFDLRSKQTLAVLTGREGIVGTVAFSPDGKQLAAASGDQMRVWDWHTGQVVLAMKGHPGKNNLNSAAFSPDGKHIAGANGVVHVWDAHTGQLVAEFVDEDSIAVAYSPDGMRIITGGAIRDAGTGRPLVTLRGDGDYSSSVAFSADGSRVATYGSDLTLRVWDSHTGKPLAALRDASLSNTIAFSPDGQHIIAPSTKEGIAKILPVTTEAIFRMACDLLRYQPEFAQVRGECQPFAGPPAGPSR